jgi:hypothetical protein
MTLSENPYFQQWIRRSVSRMAAGLHSEQALTDGATRIQCMSSTVAKKRNHALALDSERATTNLLARFKKVP